MENEIEKNDEATTRNATDEIGSLNNPQKIPENERDATKRAMDDLGKLGTPLADALMQIQEMELSLAVEEDEFQGGVPDASRPTALEDMGFEFIEENDAHTFAFGCSLSGSTVTIQEGTISLGDVDYTVSSGTVNLSGATCYVYVYLKKDKSAKGFAVETSRPTSSGDEWRWPLVLYSLSGATYQEVKVLRHGDIAYGLALGGT